MIRQLAVECRIDPSPLSLRPLRTEIEAALRLLVPESALSDVQLVVSELCTNAIVAASAHAADVVVRVEVLTPRSLAVEVEDAGPGFVPRPQPVQDSDETGRGLGIVRAVADEVTVSRSQRRQTMVRALLSWDETLELAGDLK